MVRRSLQVIAFTCTLIVGVASMAVIVTQTTWFKEWLRGFIVRQAEDYVNGRLSIGRLDGNLFFGVELEDVDVTMNGKTVVDIKDLGLDYNAFTFLGGGVVLDDIRLNRPVLRLERTKDGWNIAHLMKVRTPDPDEPKTRRPLEIGEIGVTDGQLYFERPVGTGGVEVPERIDKLNASIGIRSDEDELRVDIGHVSLRGASPNIQVNDLSGVIRRTENAVTLENVSLRTDASSLRVHGDLKNIEGSSPIVSMKASSEKLALDEVAKLVPALRGFTVQPAFELTAAGPMDRMDVKFNVRDRNLGQVTGNVSVDAAAPGRRVAGAIQMERFNVGPVARSATLKSDITGQARVDMALPDGQRPLSGTYDVTASDVAIAGYEARDVRAKGRIDGDTIRVDASAAAYGGRATAAGTVRTGTATAIDIEGRASGVDLRNLPPVLDAPGVPSDLNFTYRLTGRGRVYDAGVTLDTSRLAGATIASGTVGSVTVGQGAPSYAAKGQVSNLDLQQVGKGFDIRALATDRFKSTVNATFDMKGKGGGRYPLAVDATGTLVDSRLFGATLPRFDFTTNLAGGDASVKAIGQFSGLDPAVVSGNAQAAGNLTGAVDVSAAIRQYEQGISADSVEASGRINLGASQVAGLAIDAAVVHGRYADRAGELTELTIDGPDVNAQGRGQIALNETGSSNLTVHLESPSLDRIGKLIGQPLKGAAIVDATVTGNAKQLQAKGTLKGSNIGHGDNEALSLTSGFEVTVPDLAPARAEVRAKSDATFVELGGQTITELTAGTTYTREGDAPKIDFEATARQAAAPDTLPRELQAGGSVVLHPEHQEIHLRGLNVRSEDIVWGTEAGAEAAIQYGKERIAVRNVRLVSGEQRIVADGALGNPGDALKLQIENVDMAQVDRLLLGEQRLAGRLSAAATVTGALKSPLAEGQFTLANGAFRQFTFEALTGKVDYAGKGMNLDVRLQQNPQAWLTAKGFAPTSLLRPNKEGEGSGHEAPPAGEAVDIRVESSQIDLGVVQGFTTYVTNVTGALQANFRVTGSGTDPHLDGAIDIRGGAFAVPQLGTSYSGLDTTIELKPDALSIREMKILDSRGFPLTIGGRLAVHERELGAVDVKIESENFELIDNDLADLKLDTNLRLTGELRKPRLEGFVEVENGTINVAQLLEQTTSDPYATEGTELPGEAPAASAPAADGAEAEPTIFDALDMNIALAVPSNLVLRGQDLRAANAPIELGDMNVTVGGAIQIRKAPGGKPRIVGEVNTVRGSYTFQGRRFDLMRDGRIRFAGTDEIEPILDLRARRTISGVEAIVRVQGTMREPELSFSSNPPLDQADILSLIVFNQPINELGEGQQVSLAQRAGALAGGYLASGLARSIGNALDLDEFEIQAQGENGAGPSLSVGEQVGEKLFFRVRQGFGAEQATEFILEYQIADYLRLQGTAAETTGTQRVTFRRIERGGLDLIFFFSY